MGFLKENLQPGEEVRHVAKIHCFLFAQPAALLALGYWLYPETGVTHYAGLTLLFLGLVSLVQRIFVKAGSVYVVTNRRVVLKTGVISRRVVDLVLAKCEGLQIRQSVTGRIIGYGTIVVTTGGATNSYAFVARPWRFKREINTQIG